MFLKHVILRPHLINRFTSFSSLIVLNVNIEIKFLSVPKFIGSLISQLVSSLLLIYLIRTMSYSITKETKETIKTNLSFYLSFFLEKKLFSKG